MAGRKGTPPTAVPVPAESFADEMDRATWIRDEEMVVFQLRDPKDPIVRVDVFVEHPLEITALLDDRTTGRRFLPFSSRK